MKEGPRKIKRRKFPKKFSCPKCGAFCRCQGGKYATNSRGEEMYIQYRYCVVDDCDGSVKNAEILEFD